MRFDCGGGELAEREDKEGRGRVSLGEGVGGRGCVHGEEVEEVVVVVFGRVEDVEIDMQEKG